MRMHIHFWCHSNDTTTTAKQHCLFVVGDIWEVPEYTAVRSASQGAGDYYQLELSATKQVMHGVLRASISVYPWSWRSALWQRSRPPAQVGLSECVFRTAHLDHAMLCNISCHTCIISHDFLAVVAYCFRVLSWTWIFSASNWTGIRK